MRIVSQNGEFDLPYETTGFKMVEDTVLAGDMAAERLIRIAVYKDSKTAKEVMEQLRENFMKGTAVYYFPEYV